MLVEARVHDDFREYETSYFCTTEMFRHAAQFLHTPPPLDRGVQNFSKTLAVCFHSVFFGPPDPDGWTMVKFSNRELLGGPYMPLRDLKVMHNSRDL